MNYKRSPTTIERKISRATPITKRYQSGMITLKKVPTYTRRFVAKLLRQACSAAYPQLQTDVYVFACSFGDWRPMDWITSSSALQSGSYVTMTKEQVRRLARQLPPHDADARHCHGPLSDDDKRRLENFRDLRYRDALGQGNLRQLEKKTVCRQVCAISGNAAASPLSSGVGTRSHLGLSHGQVSK